MRDFYRQKLIPPRSVRLSLLHAARVTMEATASMQDGMAKADTQKKGRRRKLQQPFFILAPRAGLEPATGRLTAACSTN